MGKPARTKTSPAFFAVREKGSQVGDAYYFRLAFTPVNLRIVICWAVLVPLSAGGTRAAMSGTYRRRLIRVILEPCRPMPAIIRSYLV
jgi:hypothetical protein